MRKKFNTFTFCMATITIVVIGFFVSTYHDKEEYAERYVMCDEIVREKMSSMWALGFTGLNFGDFHCTWTKDRPLKDINTTGCHEMCHTLVKEYKYDHFCYQ